MINFKNFLQRAFFHSFRRRLILFFAVLGPGIITAIADNDAGGVATYTVAAATFGIASQFLVVPTTLLLGFTQDLGARLAVVTRKGLADLIRERYGIKVSILVFIIYYIVNQGVVLQNIAGLKASFEIFNLPTRFSLLLTSVVLIASVVKFSYKRIQQIFFLLLGFYVSYVVVAFIVQPPWLEVFRETVYPQKIDMNMGYWFSIIAVLGTTVTAWGQFFVASYINDKKLSISQMKYERLEIWVGALLTNTISFLMAVAVSETLFANHIIVADGASAAIALQPLAGRFASTLFALGLFGASILGLTVVPLATAYVFSELFGYEGSLDTDFQKGRLFYLFFIMQIAFALTAALFPQVNLFQLTLYVDFLNGAMLPIIFFFLIKFAEDKTIMGQYALKGIGSLFVRICGVLITIAVAISIFGKIFHIV